MHKAPKLAGSALLTRTEAVASCINGNTVDLSRASEFYRRLAKVALELTDYVEALSGNKYKLMGRFAPFFFKSLPVCLDRRPAEPVDAVAESLFQLAKAWALDIADARLLGDRNLASETSLDDEWARAWNLLDEKHWQALEEMGPAAASYITTAMDEHGGIDEKLVYSPKAHRIQLGISFERDANREPELRLLLKGEPAVRFMIAHIRKSQSMDSSSLDKENRETLRTILNSAVQAIAKEFFGLKKPTKGRPRDIGERAAYLIYHRQKPIHLAVRELCALSQEPKHTCDGKCRDRIKKAADNYFKHLQRELRSLVGSQVRKNSF
jgi:hypothetical protein